MKKFLSTFLLVVLGLVTITSLASAQLPQPNIPVGLQAPNNPGGLRDLSGGQGFVGVLRVSINLLLALAGTIAVLFIIIGGFQYILSGANEDLAKRGKTTLKNSVIGLIIIVLSYTVISVVYNTLTNVRV